MERPLIHLIFQFWHRPGFGFGVALVNLVNSNESVLISLDLSSAWKFRSYDI